MDNLTHTLTAVALSQAGLNRKTRFATLGLVLAGNAPDIDIVSRFGGAATYLKYHRGITHSLLGVTALGGVVAALIFALGRRATPTRSVPRLDGRWLFATCWIAAASHFLLDLTNSYGIRPFLPFDGRWYAWDIMFVLDPLLWGLLALGLGMPLLLRLVSEEVGAKKPNHRLGAIFALCSMVVLWGVRGVAHRRVRGLLDARTYGHDNPLRVGAFPSISNPFAWTGVAETDSAFYVLRVNALGSDMSSEDSRTYRKPEPSPALDAALKTRTATIFSDFARFPWAQVEETEDGFTVTIQDLRFISFASRRRAFLAEIELDKNLRVRSESFSFSGKI